MQPKRPGDRRKDIKPKPMGYAFNPGTGKNAGVFWRNSEKRLVGDERTGPAKRRTGLINRRKRQIGKVFHHRMTGEPERIMIKISPEEFAGSKIPKNRYTIEPGRGIFIFNSRKKKGAGRRATDK